MAQSSSFTATGQHHHVLHPQRSGHRDSYECLQTRHNPLSDLVTRSQQHECRQDPKGEGEVTPRSLLRRWEAPNWSLPGLIPQSDTGISNREYSSPVAAAEQRLRKLLCMTLGSAWTRWIMRRDEENGNRVSHGAACLENPTLS